MEHKDRHLLARLFPFDEPVKLKTLYRMSRAPIVVTHYRGYMDLLFRFPIVDRITGVRSSYVEIEV